MVSFKDMINSFKEVVFPITPASRIQQKEQTNLKNSLTDSLMDDMEQADIEVFRTQKGFILLVPNIEEGAIPVEINVITKPLDLDYISLHEEYLDKQNK